MSIKQKLLGAAAAIGLLLLAPAAYAAPIAMTSAPIAAIDIMLTDDGTTDLAVADLVTDNNNEFGADTVALSDLDRMIGAQGIPLALLTDQTLTALNTGNSLTAAQIGSGEIRLDANAFSGFSGIGNFVINSGHNNNLQSSLSVNIVMAQ